eukprot:jgi/Undpi1/10651/HiC_scaffold_29.g13101.m1
MKTGLVIAGGVILSTAGAATADECHSLCAAVKNDVSFKSGCSPFRNSLPRPKVARYCQEGFRAAVDENCYDACLNGGRLQAYLTDRRLDQVCHRALKAAPRPLCHDACVRGYRSGAEDMSLALVKLMSQVAPATFEPVREDVIVHQPVQPTRDTAAGADSALEYQAEKSATSTEAVVTEVEGETREPSKEINFADDEGRETAEKRLSAPDENGEVGLVGENDQDIPLPMDEANEIEENEAAVDEEKNSISAIGEEEEGGQGEGIDVDIEQDGDLMLSLPIAIDDVRKELVIHAGDEPTEVVLTFCAENMPDEGEDCVDYLLREVRAKLDESGARGVNFM